MKQILKVQMQKIVGSMSFQQAVEASKKLNEVCDITNQHLQRFPKDAMGLTPDAVKATDEWKEIKIAFDVSFQNLRNFNQYYTKQFKRELAQLRDEKRAAQIAKNSEILVTA